MYFFNFIKTKWQTVILSSLALLLLLSATAITVYPVYSKPPTIIINEINNGTKLSGNKVDKIVGGWDNFVLEGGEKTIVMSKFDVFNPVFSIVSKF